MLVYESTSSLADIQKGYALSIGNFDGVHLGHQQIIQTAKQAAIDAGAPGVMVMTFEPHPVAILRPEKAPGVLTPIEAKKYLLAECGVDCLVILKDSYDLLNLSPENFVDDFLMRTAAPKVVVEGPNFNFGYGRSGNVETLRTLGVDRDFEVLEVPPKEVHIHEDRRSVMCSSTMIRRYLEAGRVADAAEMLSRPYRLIGKTVSGRGVGTELGYPTANIEPLKQVIPAEGVYAGFVEVGDSCGKVSKGTEKLPAVFSIGRAKTFIKDHPLLIEAHILQENVGELYGKWLSLDFIGKIRNQQRFDSHEHLKKQIAKDCGTARDILNQQGNHD
jgi:riboflavin kinase/FMN adenylyltransferase